MHSISSFLPSTIRAFGIPRVFSALRTRKGSLLLCSVLALVLGGAWVGVHAQTAHFVEAQTVIPSTAGGIGVAVDGSGNVYIADGNSTVYKETPSAGGYAQSIVANSGLNEPQGIVVDGSGNVYFADGATNRVLKEAPSGSGYIQTVIANGGVNGLSEPGAVAVDGSGNVYIADSDNNRVLKETPTAGGYTQSVVANASVNGLNGPQGVAVDRSGNVFIADSLNGRLLKETFSAGSYTQSVLPTPGLEYPYAITLDVSGNIYIPDINASRVLKETLSAGSYTQSVVASATVGGLNGPTAVAVDGSGDVYIADWFNARILEESSSGGNFGAVNVGSTSATPISMIFTFDSAGTLGSTAVVTQGAPNLDFVNAGTGTCKTGAAYTIGESCTVNVNFKPKFAGTRYGAVELLDGSGNVLATGYVEGTGVGPQVNFMPGTQSIVANAATNGLHDPFGVAVDGSGNVYIGDIQNSRVLKETQSAGNYTQSVVANAANNGLIAPCGVAVDGGGNVYIADENADRVLKETLSADGYTQSVVANDADNGVSGPIGVAVDGSGNVYIADASNRVLKETLSAGSYTQSVIANNANNGLYNPEGVAVDGSGNVYIADTQNNRVLKETLSTGSYVQSVVADYADSGLSLTEGVAVDGSGNVYIVDEGSNRVLKETLTVGGYTQSVVANNATNGLGQPYGVAVDGEGNVYIADLGNNRALKEDLANPPSLTFAATAIGSTSSDSPQTITLVNDGNATLTFPIPTTGDDPSISTNFTLSSSVASACPLLSSSSSSLGTLAAGESCLLPISFSPTVVGSLSGSLVLTDNALNVSGSTQSISLSGTGTTEPASLLSPTPGGTLMGTSVKFAWSTGGGVSAYDLHLSAVAPGGYDLYLTGHITGTSTTVHGLPTNGETIYARLYSIINGVTVYNDYTYTAMSVALAKLTSPTPSSTLTSNSVKFTWSAGTAGSQYDLHLSAVAPGGYDLYLSGHVSGTSATATGLPTNGETIYARLYTFLNGVTVYNDYTYTAISVSSAKLTSPAPSTTLTSNSVSFTWSAGAAGSQYDLHLSAVAPGGFELYFSGHIAGTSTTVNGLPANGEKIYARLYTIVNGVTVYNDSTYTAASIAKLLSPAPSSMLTATSVTFTWSAGTAVSQYDLHLSAVAPGGFDLYYSGHRTGTSATANGLPTNGEPIYARLYTFLNGVTLYNEYLYKAQ
jgi:sugar lactone lactonase YvrE